MPSIKGIDNSISFPSFMFSLFLFRETGFLMPTRFLMIL